MEIDYIVKSSQEQAMASWIGQLNQLRLDDLVSNLINQDTNLAGALKELNNLKDFVANPEHILGSMKSKHGEIAEHLHVNIANARRIIEGFSPEHTFDGVGRTAPEDYLFNGIKVQSKYLNGLVKTITSNKGILGHLSKYPDFLNKGGIYHIPKDQYDTMQKLLSMSDEEINKASGEVRTIIRKLREFQQQTGIDLSSNSIQPAIGNYNDVQLGKINDTINNEEASIKDKDQEQRNKAYERSKPSFQEGLKVTAISAMIEGGVSFCIEVVKKHKAGKKLAEFTTEDWKDIGIDTAKSGGKGAIRGASIYGLTNFTATPAAVASALVTATFGITAQARLLRQGKITEADFIINSEVVCLDVAISAISSLMGQMMIPIPVLGAVIGNVAGMFMYGIAKDNLTKREQALIVNFNADIQQINAELDEHYFAIVECLLQEFAKFKSVLELALDSDVNVAFAGSIAMAQYVGCDVNKILLDKKMVDDYFQNQIGELNMYNIIKNDTYEEDLLADLQKYENKKMLEKADNIVLGFVGATGATGAIPIPFADAPLLIGEQIAMLAAINTVFQMDVSKDILTSLVTAVIGVGGATVVGKTIVANLLKLIPGVGSFTGGAISAATAGVITLALGKAYIEVCKEIKMGKLDQDDLANRMGTDILKSAFKEQLKGTNDIKK